MSGASEPLRSSLTEASSVGNAGDFYARFELDIVSALAEQLESALTALSRVQLAENNLNMLSPEQGVYALHKGDELVYIGKADNLRSRLEQHRRKISGRRNIQPEDIQFKALYVHKNWTALAPETSLIRHYQGKGFCEWNGNGFGPHDPGRNRELTDKGPDGFDSQYPIIDDISVPEITAGPYDALELLVKLKHSLPFLLRYEVDTVEGKKGHYKKGHAAYRGVELRVPRDGMSARDLLKMVSDATGLQATVFPSHMILYAEEHVYKHGTIL